MSTSSIRPLRRGSLCGWLIGRLISLATLLVVSAAATAANPTHVLDLAEALAIAEQRSQALPAQEALSFAGLERAVAAGRLPDPTLRLSTDSIPIEGPTSFSLDEPMSKLSISLKQTFTGSDKRRARAARWEREAGSALVGRELQRTRLRRDSALAWLDLFYQQRQVDLLTRQRDETALQIEAAEAAYRVRKGAQADVFLARSALAQIDDRLLEARNARANAVTQLARWVGDAATFPLGSSPQIDRSALLPGVLREQPQSHPEIAQLLAQERVARAEAEVARRDKRADWSVDLTYSERGQDFADMVSLGVSVPLQWDQKNRQDRELNARLARVTALRAQIEEAARERLAEVQSWYDTWRSNLVRLGEYEQTLIPLARARTEAALAAYRGGDGTLSAALDARRAEITTQLERLRIERETARLWARLEYLLPPTAHDVKPVSDNEPHPAVPEYAR